MSNGDLDIKLFEMIEWRAALRRERNEADRLSVQSGNHKLRAAHRARLDVLNDDLAAIERMIATAEVETIDGLKAKCEMLSGETTFCDADEWIMIAFALGRDAQRLGIDPAICFPPLARRYRDGGFAPSQRDVDGFTKTAREFLSRAAA